MTKTTAPIAAFETLAFQTLDVFTDQPFSGNPLAIVRDADGLTTAQMQTIAREFNLSETIFVMAPRDARHDARVRIFFPTAEIPFAGHPTIGCAIQLATEAGTGDLDRVIWLEEEAGLVPVRVRRQNGRTGAEFQAPVIPYAAPGVVPVALVAAALGLQPDDIGPHQPRVLQGGPAFLFVSLASEAQLSRARPIEPFWSDLMQQAGVDSAYLYVGPEDGRIRSRMFSPTAGIPEDPATGSATAILSAQLLAQGLLAQGETRLFVRQGQEMGRPSDLSLRIVVDGAALHSVHVGGTAVAMSHGRVRVPQA
jgi:trans-2,3-dihydro-3-hydroxyanthranilate isomerase